MRNLIFFIFLSFNCYALGQSITDSLEKDVINQFKKDSINYDFITSLSVIDSLVTKDKIDGYKKRLNSLISGLPSKESKEKKEIKRVKQIYDLVHEALFEKYEELAYFPQIFENKTYNCVTATAIYAYVFDKLEIPYVVKDAPGHVFLIAYPQTHKIHLETTVPGVYGFSNPKDSDVKEVVDNLIKFKLVTQNEADSLGYSKTYMNYFYGEDFLNKSALIGMQYYNKGLDEYSKKKYKIAKENITKSLLFFPYAPAEFLNKGLIFLTLDESKLNTLKDIEQLYEAYSSLEYKKDFNHSDIKIQLYKITDNDLNDLEFIENTVSILTKFEDEELNIKNKTFLYEYLLSKNAKADELEEIIRIADILFQMNPKNKLAKEAIDYAVFKKLSLLPYSSDALDVVSEYTLRYDFLKGNKKIDSYKIYIYGRLIDDNFKSENISLGRKYFDQFDSLIIENDNGKKLLINPELVSNIYAFVGKYYYRQNKFKTALKILNKGREIYPRHKETNKLIKWTKEEMSGKF